MPVQTEPERVRRLVRRELALIADPARRAALERILVEPRREIRDWDYGEPGERYPYWVIAEAPDRGLVSCTANTGSGRTCLGVSSRLASPSSAPSEWIPSGVGTWKKHLLGPGCGRHQRLPMNCGTSRRKLGLAPVRSVTPNKRMQLTAPHF
jgi:hypothetical protein